MTDVRYGTIVKALSGFYYVRLDGGEVVSCRAKGKFRKTGLSPLVGDRVGIELSGESGIVAEIAPRRNEFIRPPVANIDQMLIFASAVNPVTDPFLIDKMAAIAAQKKCGVMICINKADADPADKLFDVYSRCGYRTIRTSAVTGEGLRELYGAIQGKVNAFSGNSGVGKSSVINALQPELALPTGEVSEKLGRGRHTTRHIELFEIGDALVMDTPGFSSFDTCMMELTDEKTIQRLFPEFEPFLGSCRFDDCRHLREKGCSILENVEAGIIPRSRHESYVRLYEQAKNCNDWEHKAK